MCSSTHCHACKALCLVGLVVEGAGRAGVAEEGGGVADVAVLTEAGGDGGLVGEEGERVRRARRAGVVALGGLVGAGAAADALRHVCDARLEAGGAQVPLPAGLWKSWTHAQASGLVETGGAAECCVQAVQEALLRTGL